MIAESPRMALFRLHLEHYRLGLPIVDEFRSLEEHVVELVKRQFRVAEIVALSGCRRSRVYRIAVRNGVRVRAHAAPPRPRPEKRVTVELTCETCGRSFRRKKSRAVVSKRHFCSTKCVRPVGWARNKPSAPAAKEGVR